MATKKSFYQMMKEGPETWLQDALDAQEISEAERDAIQKFLNAQTREEAEKQMDVLREAMANRPEFDLSQEERNEIAQTVDDLDKHRRQLQDDINQLLARQAAINKAGQEQTFFTAEQKEELDTITQDLQNRARELGEETKRYSAYAMIQALATSEQAQEQANKWYEEVGRDQGKNLLKAISEFTQSVRAQIRGDLEQAQVHRQNASVAFHGYNDAVARDFDRRAGELIPDKAELKHLNELAKNVNQKIATFENINRDVKAKQDELIMAAQTIASNEYKYREKFGALSAWAHGTPVDKTLQQIQSYADAQKFMQSRRPGEVLRIQGELEELMKSQEEAKGAVQDELNKVLDELRGRQENLKAFVLEYENAIQHGYVDDARADDIAKHLASAQQYAFVDTEWYQTFKQFGIDIDKSFIDPSIEPEQKDQVPKDKGHEGPEGPAEPVNPQNSTQEHQGQEGPGPNPTAGAQSKPVATMIWADWVDQVENQHKLMEPTYIGIRGKNGPEVIQLSPVKEEMDKQFKFLKDHHIRYQVLKEEQVQQYREVEELKFRGARGMNREHAQAWRAFVDKAYSHSQDSITAALNDSTKQRLAPAVELVEKLNQATATQDVLTTMDELFKNYGHKDAAEILNIACDNLHNQGAQDFRQEFLQYVQDNNLQHTPYSATEVIQGLMEANAQDISGYDGPGYEDGQEIDPEIEGEEQGFDPTDGLA